MTRCKISKEIFTKGMSRLENAFRQDIKFETLQIYFEKVTKYSPEEFLRAAEWIIEKDRYFPTIARLLEIIKDDPSKPSNQVTDFEAIYANPE